MPSSLRRGGPRARAGAIGIERVSAYFSTLSKEAIEASVRVRVRTRSDAHLTPEVLLQSQRRPRPSAPLLERSFVKPDLHGRKCVRALPKRTAAVATCPVRCSAIRTNTYLPGLKRKPPSPRGIAQLSLHSHDCTAKTPQPRRAKEQVTMPLGGKALKEARTGERREKWNSQRRARATEGGERQG